MDRISRLPQEILVFIISRMTLKEATTTSLLSRRWRYLWAFTPFLDFDGMELLLKVAKQDDYSLRESELEEERSNFVKWVDSVIASHKNLTLESFTVVFNLSKAYYSSIDDWLIYALARKVQRLELNLTMEGDCTSRLREESYTSQYKIMGREGVDFSNFKLLKKISLNYVNVNGDDLELITCKYCPLLEDLSVSYSGQLLDLKIVKPFSSFKRLEINCCHHLKSAKICDATNLVYLKYIGDPKTKFLLQNVHLLFEMCIGGVSYVPIQHTIFLFPNVLAQLEKLEIYLWDLEHSWKEEAYRASANLSNLKQLVVNWKFNNDYSLLPLTVLMQALPSLERLVIKKFGCFYRGRGEREIKRVMSSYPRLKEFEFSGYQGSANDLYFVMHLLEKAVALERFVVSPAKPFAESIYNLNSLNTADCKLNIRLARLRAMDRLPQMMPPGVRLHIL